MQTQTYVTTRHTTVRQKRGRTPKIEPNKSPDIGMGLEIVAEQNGMALLDGWLPADLARSLVRHFAR